MNQSYSLALRTHLGFESRFCNPYSGNEKGSVENAVGYLRRNLMVPIPTVPDLDTFNKDLLVRCDGLLEQEHYRKKQELKDLLEQDKDSGLPLPTTEFTPVRYTTRKADREGRVKFENNYYLAHPGLASQEVTIGVGHDNLGFYNRQGTNMGDLPRCFTHNEATISSPDTMLDLLATGTGHGRKPLCGTTCPQTWLQPLMEWITTSAAGHYVLL